MSQTLGQKLALLLSSTLHDVVNRALQKNPIPVLKDVLRQHEDAEIELEETLGVALGRVRSEERHVSQQKTVVVQINATISRIYTDGDPTNDGEAENEGLKLVGEEDNLATKQQTYQAAIDAYEGLRKAKKTLERRIISLRNQISLLQAIQNEADIKKLSADILIRSANLVTNNVTSVDNMAEIIKTNRDQQDARFEMSLTKMETLGADPALEVRASDRLAQIRKRLGVDTGESTTAVAPLDMSADDLKVLSAN